MMHGRKSIKILHGTSHIPYDTHRSPLTHVCNLVEWIPSNAIAGNSQQWRLFHTLQLNLGLMWRIIDIKESLYVRISVSWTSFLAHLWKAKWRLLKMVRIQRVLCIYLLAQNSVSFIPLIAVENVLSFLPSELPFMSFQLASQKLEPVRTAPFLLFPGL
jgi:hypothetical protein